MIYEIAQKKTDQKKTLEKNKPTHHWDLTKNWGKNCYFREFKTNMKFDSTDQMIWCISNWINIFFGHKTWQILIKREKKMAVCCVIRHSVGGPCQSADHYTSTNTGRSQSYFTYTISAIGAKPIQWEIFLLRHVMLSPILFRGGISFWWPGRLQCNNEISPMWLSLV